MNDIQLVLYRLLQEIDNICRMNNIDYFLDKESLIGAIRCGGFEGDSSVVRLLMPAASAEVFAKIMENDCPEDRFFECMLNNNRFPKLCMYYGDRTTLDFSTNNWGFYDNYGIKIIIEILRPADKYPIANSLRMIAEESWESFCDTKRFASRRNNQFKIMKALSRILGRDRLARITFKFILSPHRSSNGYCYIKKYFRRRRTLFPKKLFDSAVFIRFEDLKLPVPVGYDDYLQHLVGFDWKESVFSQTQNNSVFRMVDPEMPFEDYLHALQEESIDLKDSWKIRERYVAGERTAKRKRKIMRRSWDYLFLCGDRYILWKKYKPQKLLLRELYRQNDVKGMINVLQDYIDAAEKHMKSNLGLYFDDEIYYYFLYSMSCSGRKEFAKKVKTKAPELHVKERIKLKDYKGNLLPEQKEISGMKKAEKNVVPALLAYLRPDVGNCVYMYIDIAKYGLDNPNMDVWYDTDDEGINLVVMKYYNSISIYSRTDTWNVSAVSELINEYKVGMVSGQQNIIERIYPNCGENYDLEIGYVFKLTQFREFPPIVSIEDGNSEDCLEIAKLICSNDSIGGYYEIENLANQLKERLETGIGRSLVIRKEGDIIAHIASYAEYDGIATTAGLIAIDDGSNIPYGTLLESRLINDLLKEDFEVFTFVTEDRRARFFKTMGCEEIGRYGKMTLK